MLSHSGSVSVLVSLLTFEGKYTFSGYLLRIQCFGTCLPMLCFIWELSVQRWVWITWVMRLCSGRLRRCSLLNDFGWSSVCLKMIFASIYPVKTSVVLML